ncbi:MAG: hypothetical protein AAF674_04255 [Pseudomonadota bacterium]
MPRKKWVVESSIEAPGGHVCVDIFRRWDESWGFEEYRRDPEDPHGWRQIGYHDHRMFPDRAACLSAACESVSWLSEVI